MQIIKHSDAIFSSSIKTVIKINGYHLCEPLLDSAAGLFSVRAKFHVTSVRWELDVAVDHFTLNVNTKICQLFD